MQVGATLQANNISFLQPKRCSFKCHQSTLNPSSSFTKKHLANLEKLLQKQSATDPIKPDSEHVRSNRESSIKRGNPLLDGLNLARIWPGIKAIEEMSPRDLNKLQRLLSMSPEYSPRNNLGLRWREYHGCDDWRGLLDPLDENLRRELVRYGEFVQAAYYSFNSNPAMSASQPPPPRHVVIPDRSYKVTKNLYATSSVGLPKWVDDVAPDLGWLTQRSSWIGYVAVCDDGREIQRMGRRDIVISLRGTATCLEWAENMRAQLIQTTDKTNSDQNQQKSKVEQGFLSLYKTDGAHVSSLSKLVTDEVKRLVELYKGETLSITVTGHSLGAALALLVANDLTAIRPETEMPPIAVFSFGGPRVGNKAFSKELTSKNVKVLRIVNNQDVITKVPGLPMVEELNDDLPMAYAHVGTELRVDTRMSPYLKPNADVACCHDLEAYLHLVDGFLASNCPFRSNAKRSLVKLLNEQRGNVKQLYTRKANALKVILDKPGLGAYTNCVPSPSSLVN